MVLDGHEEASRDLPAARAADRRPAAEGRAGEGRLARGHAGRDLGRDGAPPRARRAVRGGVRRLPRRGLRAQRVLARAHGEPGRREPRAGHGRPAAARHRVPGRRPRRPDDGCRAGRARASSSCADRRCSSGYYGKPEETEAVFVDGWFRTGDIVTIDEAGFVRIVDRIKELIITGGFNVAPTEVENALRQHPQSRTPPSSGCRASTPARRSSRRSCVAPGADDRRRGDPRVRARHPHAVQGAPADLRRRRAAEVAHRQGAAASGARLAAAADDRHLTGAAVERSVGEPVACDRDGVRVQRRAHDARRDRRVGRPSRRGRLTSSGASKIVMPNVPTSTPGCVRRGSGCRAAFSA